MAGSRVSQVVVDHVAQAGPVDQVLVRVDDQEVRLQNGFVASHLHLTIVVGRKRLGARFGKGHGGGEREREQVSAIHFIPLATVGAIGPSRGLPLSATDWS